MDPHNLAKLCQYYPMLIQDMDAMPIVDHLVATSIFNDYHRKDIQKQQGAEEKNRLLLEILKNKDSGAYHTFIVALRETNQHSLATLLGGQNHTEDLQLILRSTQESIKENYLLKFRIVYPFSLPFTFDTEKTWVSLALQEDCYHSNATEDHAELLKRAFKKEKMLIIEGDPATGKTSLMRRLAYEWARGKEELLHYDLVLYAEFREVYEQKFESISDLVLLYSKKYLENEDFERLALLMGNKLFCRQSHILLLLDGYDESSLDKQCSELQKYLFENTINKPLLFNIVVTTRKGYLSSLRGYQGRFVFAEVLGFITNEQKKIYISNHFSSVDNSAENIRAVHHLLNKNKNMNKLAETPLFLTFICLVHEHITEGTLLELYCNIIWWLIDRHQKDFPDRNIPALFGYENNSDDKFETVQEHYLEFPQLHSLSKMAFTDIKKDVFNASDAKKFNLQPIIEQVGLLRKERNHDRGYRLITKFSFPHRTVQEFLAALYCFISHENTDQWFSPNSKMDIYEMKEFEKFLLRIALSKQIPINTLKHIIYFERIAELTLDLTFDAFNTAAGLNSKLLNWFISQCTHIQILEFNKRTYQANEPQISVHFLSFTNLVNLYLLAFNNCIFEASSQISFTNCPSMNSLECIRCEVKSSVCIDFSKLPALDNLKFWECAIDMKAWQSITDEITRCSVKCLKLSSDFFIKEYNLEFGIHLRKCECIKKIIIDVTLLNTSEEEQLTKNLSQLTREMKGLSSIIFHSRQGRRLKDSNKKIIEKAGQERDAAISITYDDKWTEETAGITRKPASSYSGSNLVNYSSLSKEDHKQKYILFVRDHFGRERTIDCLKPTDKVLTLAQEICRWNGVPPEEQNLLYDRTLLNMDATLSNCNIRNESRIEIVLRLARVDGQR